MLRMTALGQLHRGERQDWVGSDRMRHLSRPVLGGKVSDHFSPIMA